jgi:hypothetical protein
MHRTCSAQRGDALSDHHRVYRTYPVRVDEDGNVRTLDGVVIGGAEMAAIIQQGFEAATPMRGLDEILSGTGIKVKRKTG